MQKLLLALFLLACGMSGAQEAIRINQLGYLPQDIKQALWVSREGLRPSGFELLEAGTNRLVYEKAVENTGDSFFELKATVTLDFSDFELPGRYYLKSGKVRSSEFTIADTLYNGAADRLLAYLRSRRCGYNPHFRDSCHTRDGVIIYHPELEGQKIDVSGGWHDASDYLQYVTTSAHTVFQLLFAYEHHPKAFKDKYLANGDPGSNGVPDVLDEARWGLEWLLKMNPSEDLMFHQIADDRDHRFFGFPAQDTVDYGYGKGMERPVYFVTGKPQGLKDYKNQSDGKANIAGKFASCFALGAQVFRDVDPAFSEMLKAKAAAAYQVGIENPGVCQTAPCNAPYYYEESNWTDDMELAAIQLFRITQKSQYRNDALRFAQMEPEVPWMARDTARHYQFYPFINHGRYYLAASKDRELEAYGLKSMKRGLESNRKKAEGSVLKTGIPFIWCSNNLVASVLSQQRLYASLQPADTAYRYNEAALRDWLFGRNPWGTSMIVGFPDGSDTPADTHSAISHFSEQEPLGGLVDGPVYNSIFSSLKGVRLSEPDEYESYQTSRVVYHDDWADYATNEPTMDGTASLVYYLASLHREVPSKAGEWFQGARIRGDRNSRKLALVFTGHDRAEGLNKVLKVLEDEKVQASFFLTGDFLRTPGFRSGIKKILKGRHYLGAHSDKHLLYCSWEDRDQLLLGREAFSEDLRANYRELEKYGVNKENALLYLPPYEWYNDSIAKWTEEEGLQLINHSPGTLSNQDWTFPGNGGRYYTNAEIWASIRALEQKEGLGGFQLLMHFGTHPARMEKFYEELPLLIAYLREKGYQFVRVNDL